jgi:hypothetical protein
MLAGFLRDGVSPRDFPVDVAPLPLPTSGDEFDALALDLADTRILDPTRPPERLKSMDVEVDVERRRLIDPDGAGHGAVYDGFEVLRLFKRWTGNGGVESFDVVLTRRLVGTWDPSDRRVHARVAIYGFPSLLSVPGLVAAPAPSRERALARRLGLRPEPLGSGEGEGGLAPGDPRTTDALKGYLLQALFYHLFGSPFCQDLDCRLFNAHRQEELLRAQRGEGTGLCGEHEAMLFRAAAGEPEP